MRKLSCKWPVCMTVLVFLSPVFYVLHRIGKPEIINDMRFIEKVVVAVVLAIIVWLVYGVACLLARKSKKTIEGGQDAKPKTEQKQ